MIFHIGKGNTLKTEDIIGIFDLDNATVSGTTRKFLAAATQRKKVFYGDHDIPRSFLLVGEKKASGGRKNAARREKKQEDGERPVLYLSHISSLSLMTRAENPLSFMEEE